MNRNLSFAPLFIQKKSSPVETAELNDCLPYEKSSNALFLGGSVGFFHFFLASLFERLPAIFAIACQFFTVAEAKIPRLYPLQKSVFGGFYDAKKEKVLLKAASPLHFTLNYP